MAGAGLALGCRHQFLQGDFADDAASCGLSLALLPMGFARAAWIEGTTMGTLALLALARSDPA